MALDVKAAAALKMKAVVALEVEAAAALEEEAVALVVGASVSGDGEGVPYSVCGMSVQN